MSISTNRKLTDTAYLEGFKLKEAKKIVAFNKALLSEVLPISTDKPLGKTVRHATTLWASVGVLDITKWWYKCFFLF